jgi:hypothetical protein
MITKLTLSFARLLLTLLETEVNAAAFSSSNKKLLDQFLRDSVLEFRPIGNQKRKILCRDKDNLSKYLHNKFEIPSLIDYIAFLEQEEFQRSDAVRAASDTKIRKTRVFTGFLLNCYETIECELHGNPFSLLPATGAFTFISDFRQFKIPEDVTVIVVEGHENFREINRERYLFEGARPLFVWRYQNSNSIADWLNFIPNQYIHFGDFDPKGIHIYLSEFKNKIKGNRGEFLIPKDLEKLLTEHGEKDLYEKQKEIIPLIRRQDQSEVQLLLELIVKVKKGLAQEILIR